MAMPRGRNYSRDFAAGYNMGPAILTPGYEYAVEEPGNWDELIRRLRAIAGGGAAAEPVAAPIGGRDVDPRMVAGRPPTEEERNALVEAARQIALGVPGAGAVDASGRPRPISQADWQQALRAAAFNVRLPSNVSLDVAPPPDLPVEGARILDVGGPSAAARLPEEPPMGMGPGVAPDERPLVGGRGGLLGGVGRALMFGAGVGPGPEAREGEPNVADRIAESAEARPEERMLAEGTTQQEVEQQLREAGYSPEQADLMMVRDGTSGRWQAWQMPRSPELSGDQLREERYRQGMEALREEAQARRDELRQSIRRLRRVHSDTMQDLDRAISLSGDPQERVIYEQAKAQGRNTFMQALNQLQTEGLELDRNVGQLMSAYATDRYRGGARPTEEQAELDRQRHQQRLDYLRRQQEFQTEQTRKRYEQETQTLALRYGLDAQEFVNNKTVQDLLNEKEHYRRIQGDWRTSPEEKRQAQAELQDADRRLTEYMKALVASRGKATPEQVDRATTPAKKPIDEIGGVKIFRSNGEIQTDVPPNKIPPKVRRQILAKYGRG